jgi:hypothetical protein
VKLLASAAALVFALLLVPAAASAAPRAVDFELAPGHDAVAAAAGGAVRSRPLQTPGRFNLVGMRWRGRGQADVRVRVRRPGGWSRWERLEVPGDHNPDPGRGEPSRMASDPLWVGSAGAVQYRTSRRVRGLRLHFVRVSGARLPRAAARAAQAGRPHFVSRAQWGARACPPRSAPAYGEVKAVHVHHTVSLNDYSPDDSAAMVLAICRYHRNSNGWDDIGYNALVDKYGLLFEGRAGGLDKPVIGAQAQGFNAQTAGISSIGDHSTEPATPETLAAIASYIRWKLPVEGQPLSGAVTLTSAGGSLTRYGAGARVRLQRVIGHRDTGRTACPGNALYRQLSEIRRLVQTGSPGVTARGTRLSALLSLTEVTFGEAVPVSGTLRSADGSPLPGETVLLQVNHHGRWRTARQLITAADGAFATELHPRLRMYVRIRFRGRSGLGRSGSPRLLLHLRPVISIVPPPAEVEEGTSVPIRGQVAPRKRVVYLGIRRQAGRRWKRVGVRAVRVRRGGFRTSFTPTEPGTYRFFLVSRWDVDTDRSRLGPYEVRATG